MSNNDINILDPEILIIIFSYLKDWYRILYYVNRKWRSIILSINDSKIPYFIVESLITSIEIIKWAHLYKISLTYNIINRACLYGKLEIIKYLWENGCECNKYTCAYAAFGGNLDCLKFLYENGCKWDNKINFIDEKDEWYINNLSCLHNSKYPWTSNVAVAAASNGKIECLKYCYENGCAISVDTANAAALNGHLCCLQYLHENNCTWNNDTCKYAAFGDNLNCLKYLHENGCKWDQYTSAVAAEYGHLDILKYLHENECPGDLSCEYAATGGNLECLKFLHEHGYPWNKFTCIGASCNGNLECLKYAHENGCEWDRKVCDIAISRQNIECLKYAYKNGCPCDKEIIIKFNLI